MSGAVGLGKVTDLLRHPDEILPVVWLVVSNLSTLPPPRDPDLAFCYKILSEVSQSYPVLVRMLPAALRDPICITYLVLKAMDTVEDDMTIPDDVKIPLVRNFYKNLSDKNWSRKSNYGRYAPLLEQFPVLNRVYHRQSPEIKQVIADTCKTMGNGMADFLEKDGIKTKADYDLYCYYVSGFVGVTLTKLMILTRVERGDFMYALDGANELGLVLQKLNIISDYHEDINEVPAPRMYWPQEIWELYGDKLEDFKDPANEKAAVQCLNHMLSDCLQHFAPGIKALSLVRSQKMFNILVIPAITAFVHISRLYNNPNVFRGTVKARKGEVAKLVVGVRSMPALYRVFLQMTIELEARVRVEGEGDANQAAFLKGLHSIQDACAAGLASYPRETSIINPASSRRVQYLVLVVLSFLLVQFIVNVLLLLSHRIMASFSS